MKSIILLIIFAIGIAAFFLWPKYRCITLDACEQYTCLDPNFYCAKTLYESGITPESIADAKKIVMDYVKQRGLTAKVNLATRIREPYRWFLIGVDLSDGSEYGYEVGPDGNIYEIKRYK